MEFLILHFVTSLILSSNLNVASQLRQKYECFKAKKRQKAYPLPNTKRTYRNHNYFLTSGPTGNAWWKKTPLSWETSQLSATHRTKKKKKMYTFRCTVPFYPVICLENSPSQPKSRYDLLCCSHLAHFWNRSWPKSVWHHLLVILLTIIFQNEHYWMLIATHIKQYDNELVEECTKL